MKYLVKQNNKYKQQIKSLKRSMTDDSNNNNYTNNDDEDADAKKEEGQIQPMTARSLWFYQH